MSETASVRFVNAPGRLGELQAQASSYGGLVFTCGMTGHDARTGILIERLSEVPRTHADKVATGMVIADVPEDRILAQTIAALMNAGRALEAAGSSLERLVRLRLFLRDRRDLASAATAVKAMLGERTPTTTIIEANGPGMAPEIDIVLDAVGVHRADAREPTHAYLPNVTGLLRDFPAASSFGGLVFTAPISGFETQPAGGMFTRAALTNDERALLDDVYHDPRAEALCVEQVLMWRNLRAILNATNVRFENIVHQSNWLAVSMQDYSPVTRVRSRLFGREGGRTAATSLPISALRVPGAAFECSVIGISDRPDAPRITKEIKLASHGVGPYYVGAVKAGAHVFAAGEVPVRARKDGRTELVAAARDLDDDFRLLNLGRGYREYPLAAQAHFVLELISEALAGYGIAFDRVLHQTVYLVEPAQYPIIERLASLRYGVRLPPTTLVPIRGASPYRGTLLEIEVTAAARD